MKRLLPAALTFALTLPAFASGIDERYVRDGAQGWGQRIAAKVGVKGFGRSIAVIVGVGAYSNGWNRLEAPSHDAVRMRSFLRETANFDIIYTMTDAEVTLPKLRKLMAEELPLLIGPNDRVLFYFSGHGTQRALFGDKTIGYLVLPKSSPEGWASMIDMRDVERWWEGLAHAKQSLFILDACFSGLGLQGKGDTLRERTIAELSRRGHHLITAGSADQESFASLSRWGGSLFTTALLDGMRGRADSSNADAQEDGIISLKELWDYVSKRIRSEVPPNTMTPQLAGFEFSNAGEFFFVAVDNVERTETAPAGIIQSKGGTPAMELDPREMQLWNDVKDSGDAAMLQHFMSSYPDSVFAPLANSRHAALQVKPETPLIAPETLFSGQTNTRVEERFTEAEIALVEGDTMTAIRSLKLALAADENHAPSLRELGKLYLSGDGILKDETKGREMLERAAILGDAEAERLLNGAQATAQADALYKQMRDSLLIDPTRTAAAALTAQLETMANAGDARAQIYVAMIAVELAPAYGEAGAQYALTAVDRAAASTDPLAPLLQVLFIGGIQSQLAASLVGTAEGLPPPDGIDAALRAAEKAANEGDPLAAVSLASLYIENAIGVVPDSAKAQKYGALARAKGFDPDWF